MKPSQALFACSLLGVACAISCGSDDEKNKAVASDAGAGGEGAVTAPGDGGRGGEPSVVVEGGAGGEPPVVVPGGAGGVALGGAGGEPAACIPYDVPGVGGEGGAPPAEGEPLFWCRGVVGQYRKSTRKITIITPPGLEATAAGKFVASYGYWASPEAESQTYACSEGSVTGTGNTLELSTTFEGEPADYVDIPAIAVQDACGTEVRMNRTSSSEGWCLTLRFQPSSESEVWNVECYEGFTDDCPTEPVCPETPPTTTR